MLKTKIKICGLYRIEDIMYVNEALPDYVGFIINFPKSHRCVTINQVANFKQVLVDTIQTVGVFVDAEMEEIMQASEYLDVIQLHGHEDNRYIEQLCRCLPKKEIWKAFKIRTVRDLEEAADSIADRIVLDNGYGTGSTFDWDLLKHLAHAEKSLVLAGGLGINNIENAIGRFHPYALDMSSGVETDKKKDRDKMIEVVRKTRQLTRGE